MERTFDAFISLGFPCGGPEAGDFGTFTVELDEEEMSLIDEVIQEKTIGYKRFTLAERFPNLHNKIVDAASELVRDIIILSAPPEAFPQEDYEEIEEELSEIENVHDKAEYLVSRIPELEPESLDGAEVCYYLCKEETPFDYDRDLLLTDDLYKV